MTSRPPDHLSNARVLLYSPLDSRHKPSGTAPHAVHGHALGPVAGLAIGQYEGDPHVYLFAAAIQPRIHRKAGVASGPVDNPSVTT